MSTPPSSFTGSLKYMYMSTLQVVVGGHGAVEHADDGEPVVLPLDGVAEDVELAGKARQRRDAREGEQEDGHAEG